MAETAALVTPDAARRGVAVDLDLAPDLPPVLGDRVQLKQVVLNLLLNGLDAAAPAGPAAPGGPRASLAVRTRRGGAAPRAAGGPAGEVVEVVVRDSGPGLDPETAGRLFEPFYTTKPDGLGMGLAIEPHHRRSPRRSSTRRRITPRRGRVRPRPPRRSAFPGGLAERPRSAGETPPRRPRRPRRSSRGDRR